MGSGEAYTGFWWGSLGERDLLGDSGVDGRMLLRWILRKWDVGVEWIGLAQDSDRMRTLVNAVMKLRAP